MSKVLFQTSNRFDARQFASAFGGKVDKMLVEIITNSDDNYRKIEKEEVNKNKIFNIKILLDAKEKRICVLDEGTGMTKKELEEKFQILKYGDKKSTLYEEGGTDSRGMFGQGITDVLFHNDDGYIKCVTKIDQSYCFFDKSKNEYNYDVSESIEIKKEIKRLFHVDIATGTLITFKLNEKTPFPKYENIVEKVSNSPMLRLINENSNRKIKLIYLEKKKTLPQKTAIIKYQETPSNQILIKKIKFKYEKYPLEGELILNKSKSILNECSKGILVFDHGGSVCGLENFGYEHEQNLDYLFGRLRLDGVKQIIKDKLDLSELILTDSRDGFNKNHKFYLHLKKKISEILQPILQQNQENDDEKDNTVSTSDSKMFKKINEYYEPLFESNEGGLITGIDDRVQKGMEFVREDILIKKDCNYKIELKIDPNIISTNKTIKLKNQNKNIVFQPKEIELTETDFDKKIIKKYIDIRGNEVGDDKLVASIDNISAILNIRCDRKKYVYPENGLQFDPTENVYCRPETDKKIHLYIDLNKIKKGVKIALKSSNNKIKLKEDFVFVPKNALDWTDQSIAKVDVFLRGKNIGDKSNITAKYLDYETNAIVEIKNTPDLNLKKKGIFNGWKFKKFGKTFFPPWKHEDDGFIAIHADHPINKYYFGDNPTKKKVEMNPKSQLYLSELITDAVIVSQLSNLVNKKIIDSDHESIMYHIYKTKIDLGKIVYETQVNFKQEGLQDKLENIPKNNVFSNVNNNTKIKILYERFINAKTLEQIGKEFSITRERVRQIIKKNMDIENKTQKICKINTPTIQKKEKKKDNKKLIEKIIKDISVHYEVTVKEIKGKNRKKNIVLARHMIAYKLKEKLDLPFSKIGKLLGDRDHTTIIHACNKIKKMKNQIK